jgi:fructoselysine-6-P-deglycase FrlB-like protein
VWRRTLTVLTESVDKLPGAGGRVALIGCGTSFYVGQAVAVTREAAGQGEADAFVASEMPRDRDYDAVIAISRSGTTTEVIRALATLPPNTPSLAITAVPESPVAEQVTDAVLLPFADEESVVQTRFATAVVALFRAHAGEDMTPVIADAERAIASELPADPTAFRHFVFLGTGASVGLAAEAALKFREAAGAWSEAYPAMEYRHGPISVAGERTLVWGLTEADSRLVNDIRATGAHLVQPSGDPLAELVAIHRAAVALAEARGMNPDQPHNLTRSVVLQ